MAEYIEREEAIRVLSNPIRKSMCVSIDEYKYRYRQRETDLELIKSLTAADIQPVKHGKWKQTGGKYSRHKTIDRRILTCSVCGNFLSMEGVNAGRGDANYCPNCGARMDGEI